MTISAPDHRLLQTIRGRAGNMESIGGGNGAPSAQAMLNFWDLQWLRY